MESLVVAGVGVVVSYPDSPGAILCVEEGKADSQTGKRAGMISVPAGHIKINEGSEEAAIREVLEETGYQITLHSVLGIYLISGALGVVYRAFTTDTEPAQQIDPEIKSIRWMKPQKILRREINLRPGMREILSDYIAGASYPLEIVRNCLPKPFPVSTEFPPPLRRRPGDDIGRIS